jgi:hypothetical protein
VKRIHHLATFSTVAALALGGVVSFGPSMLNPKALAQSSEVQDAPIPGLRNIFRAGFEEPVLIEADKEGNRAWLRGKDEYGDAWDDLEHVFEFVAPQAFGDLVEVELSEEHVHSGQRSLFMRQNREQDGAQNRLQFYSDDAAFNGEIFTRRHYFIPSSNLGSLAEQDNAVSIAGTREVRDGTAAPGSTQADFSIPLYLVRRDGAVVFALAIVDYSAGPKWSDWTRPPGGLLTYGEDTPVPLDRWFELEVYVLRDPTEGTVKVWLDGEMIFDVENIRTKNDTDTWFTKLADVDAQPAPFELWVDDVEIWTR